MDAEQDLEIERHGNEVCLDRSLFWFQRWPIPEGRYFKKCHKNMDLCEHREQDIHEADNIAKIKLWIL